MESRNKMNFNNQQLKRITSLRNLLDKGVVSKKEYIAGISRIEHQSRASQPKSASPSKKPEVVFNEKEQDLIAKMKTLVQKGIMNQQEYDTQLAKMEQIVIARESPGTAKENAPEHPHALTPQRRKKSLAQLTQLRDKGVFSLDEFETKKKMLFPLTQEQLDDIAKLRELTDKGILTQQEFETKKQFVETQLQNM
jgi:DNA-binding HxlR family transcriptional regulator